MTTRRSRGDGGLHWDEGRRRWIATASLGHDPAGRRIIKRASGRTKTEAKSKLKEIIRDYADGLAIAPTNYTVEDAVRDWLRYGLSSRDKDTFEVNRKTRLSRRTLALPGRCIDALSDHRRNQVLHRHGTGPTRSAGLVFCTASGRELDAAHVRRAFRIAIRTAEGVDAAEWTPREMRHSFVSLLSDSGVTLEEISQLVSHKNTTVTALVYRKQIRPVIQTGATAMDRLFSQDRKG